LNAKQYLSRGFYLRSQIRDLDERIEQLRHRMSSVGAIRYDKVNVQSSPEDPMLANIAYLIEAEKKLVALEADLERVCSEIREKIDLMDDELLRTILLKRYVYNRSMRRIAKDLNYSFEWMRHLHVIALREFSKILCKTTHKNTSSCGIVVPSESILMSS